MNAANTPPSIHAVDLFCGVGGLSHGLHKAGINIVAGIDLDATCKFAFEANIEAPFICEDIRKISVAALRRLYPADGVWLLAGCAPCQPFSKHMRGADTSSDDKWSLLDEFSRLAIGVRPHLVTMENVVGLARTTVFRKFVSELEAEGYDVAFKSCYGPSFGLAQHRRRLVLVASLIGDIASLPDQKSVKGTATVRDVIGSLPPVASGQAHPKDPLHKARVLSPINLERMKQSVPGGTWADWPSALRAPCHQKKSGQSFQSVYARMSWDEPSPTITTQAYSFGTGRFGHPQQDRALTLREAAMLQGFPKSYEFVAPGSSIHFTTIGRQIGNAVPPPLGRAIGKHLVSHVAEMTT